jgi:hypothetical protein
MSKIVENDRNLLKDALMEYNAIKEEAIKVAKDRLAKSMPDVIEKFLKEEIENKINEEGILSTESSIVKEQDPTMAKTMKETPVSESEHMEDEMESEEEKEEDLNEDELTVEAIKEALAELEEMDLGDDMKEGMYEDDKDMVFELDMEDEDMELGEDASFSFDLEGDNLSISDINSHGKEFDDIEIDLESDEEDMEDEMESEDEFEVEMDDESEDDFEMESEDGEDVDLDSLEDEEEVKEEGLSHVITHQNARQVGSEGNVNYGKAQRLRQESVYKKDIDKLIKENNDLKSINLEFKDALKKYKTQLYEMAVFNANLSHVNNLFVEHTTTVDEKKQILNKFKSVATIEESKSVYNKFVSTLNESKKTKKTIEERVEKPSVGGDSGSQKLNESLSTQNEPDSVKAIKKMMKYIETKRK